MKLYLKKLNQILQYKTFYAAFLFLVILYVLLTTVIIKQDSILKEGKQIFTGTVIDISKGNSTLTLKVSGKEKILAFFDNNSNISINYGDKVRLIGELNKPKTSTLPNHFNYKKYLYNNGIFYVMNVDNFEIISRSKNVLYKIKNYIFERVENNKSSDYLKTFVLGKNSINSEIKEIYTNIGIIHLFSISGMHISFFTIMIIFLLKKISNNELVMFFIVSIFLFIYLFLTNFSPSIVRCTSCYFISGLLKMLGIKLDKKQSFIISISIIVIINPFIIYKTGFIYSTVISFFLLLFSKWINKTNNYLIRLFIVSFISFLSSIPITISFNYQLNYLSIIYNIFAVPFVSFILFPLSLLCFLIPFLSFLLNFFIIILETFSKVANSLDSVIIFRKPSIFFIVIYYLVLLICRNKIKHLILLFVLIFFQYNYNFFVRSSYIIAFDVGQGDSSLIISNSRSILIDTGGKYGKSSLSVDMINSFKSLGIRKLNTIIISHGDFDHMGEAINLVNNFKVEKVIFNCGTYNDLEKELIKVLDKKKIKYYSCIKELNIDKNKLYFLQTKGYDNENDNSNVIYTELDGYKFMFMGDASSTAEKEILSKYNLPDIDVLKVGHHGSNTSSSKEFINEISPKYSIISVGKNNRYGHPNKEVLNNLEDLKIYRTDEDGSIMFKIKNNKLKIETCSP